MAVPRPHS